MTIRRIAAVWRRGLSVRARLLAMAGLLVVLLGFGSVVQVRLALQQTVGSELSKRSLSLARAVALRVADPLLTRNTLEVGQILRDVVQNDPDVRYAFVVDARGKLIAHTFAGGFPRDLLSIHPRQPGDPADVLVIDSDEGPIHDAAASIVGGLAGYARVGLSEAGLAASVRRAEQAQVLVAALGGLLLLLVSYVLIMRLTARLKVLGDAARAVGAGDLSVRVVPGPADEFGALARSFNDMIAGLAAARVAVQAKEQARTALLQKLLTAQEEERRRISQELHDEVGQALTGLMVGLQVLGDPARPSPDQVADLRRLAAQTLESVRRLSRDLRPAVLDDMGLVAAVRRYIDDFRRLHGIGGSLQVVGPEDSRLPAAVETTLYRVIQEALTNVARHSKAEHFGVLLDVRGPVAMAMIEDDGRGFDAAVPRQGLGLAGMAERASTVGGTLMVESRPGSGTTVFIRVPVGEGVGARAPSDRG